MSTELPPCTICCAYCGRFTPDYQLVSQVPESKSKQSFIITEIFGTDNHLLKGDDYVCFNHEETFRIKYLCFLRKQPFSKSSVRNRPNTNKELPTTICIRCGSTNAVRYYSVEQMQSQELKNFLVNEVKLSKERVTRKGTGISETDLLCRPCYYVLRKKYVNVNYTPRKLQSSSNSHSLLPTEVGPGDDSSSSDMKEIGIQSNSRDNCIVCGKGRSKKGASLRCIVDSVRQLIDIILNQTTSEVSERIRGNAGCSMIHKGGKERCYEQVMTEAGKLMVCVYCGKNMKKGKLSKIQVTQDMSIIIDQWVENTGDITKCTSYKKEIHHECYNAIKEQVKTTYIDEVLPEEFDRETFIMDILNQILQEYITNQIPAHLPTVFIEMKRLVENNESELNMGTDEIERHEFDAAIDKFLTSNLSFKVHQTSRKSGRLLYNHEWDLVSRLHEISCELQDNEESLRCNVRSNMVQTKEMFYCIKELREHVKKSGKLCELYARYPELLQSLKLEEILFTGVRVNLTGKESADIPPLDPLLFNVFYFMTCNDKEAEQFEQSFSPAWDEIYIEGYKKETKIVYSRVMSTVFDILHQRNKDNVYPLHILFSDMIANSKPTRLMDDLCRHRKCASPRKYDEYKITMASNVRQQKAQGVVLGLIPGKFTSLHMDNLEQYQRHARNPAASLTSSLVIAAQQPLPSLVEMNLQEGIDLNQTATELSLREKGCTDKYVPETPKSKHLSTVMEDIPDIGADQQINIFYKPPGETEHCCSVAVAEEIPSSISHVDFKVNDPYLQKSLQCKDTDDVDNFPQKYIHLPEKGNRSSHCSDWIENVPFQPSMSENEVDSNSLILDRAETMANIFPEELCVDEMSDKDGYQSDSMKTVSSSESSDSIISDGDDYIPPATRSSTGYLSHHQKIMPESEVEFKPRFKRLRLDFETAHGNISEYDVPEYTEQELRQCVLQDFLLTDKEKTELDELNVKLLVHTLLHIEGQECDIDSPKQCVPSFKETIAWSEPMVEKTNTVYLELIPGKPDSMDTILYALSLVKELFVEKLGFKYVVVCGDGKTVNYLYKIKDEYGTEMLWLLVMLGTWHMLKDYLGIFLKKYENVFIRHLLLKVLTKGNVDSIISCSTWWRSHNYTIWIMSALLRENIAEYLKYDGIEKHNDLLLQVKNTVDILRLPQQINEIQTSEFAKEMKSIYNVFLQNKPEYDAFMTDGFKNDDQFALFSTAIEDFLAYLAVYIAIRTSNWDLRLAGMKMMACRFVRSGATLYQWLVLRHLADIATSFPDNVISRFESGGWVSALKDGKGVTLARDEYHERTASRDIQLVMPKQLTKQNMEVITQYTTYGATTRNNLLAEIFCRDNDSGFELAKGCSHTWLDMQEKFICIFSEMLRQEHPFKIEMRLLRQPFTKTTAKDSIKKDFLGRNTFGDERKDYGKEVLISYVNPRFCNNLHKVDAEKMPMQRRTLALFPPLKPHNSQYKKTNVMKEKENMMQVLAAGIVKLSTTENRDPRLDLAGCQISDIPGLFADSEFQQYRKKNKTGLRKTLEKRYNKAFIPPNITNNCSVYIRDGMQDLYLSPLKHHFTFAHYFNLFWEVKVRRSFSTSSTVVVDFDMQKRTNVIPKDSLHVLRDEVSGKVCNDIVVSDDTIIPVEKSSWICFLGNRKNKANLVWYICEKMKLANSSLFPHEKLILSFEGNVFEITTTGTKEMQQLHNNHNESDTRVFFLHANLDEEKSEWIIRSTDSDILFTALLNHDKLYLTKRKLYLHYNTNGEGRKFCCINTLVGEIEEDPSFSLLRTRSISSAKLVGLLHFISGCDDLSFLRGFTKNMCFKTFVKYSEIMCPENPEIVHCLVSGEPLAAEIFMVKYLSCLYCHKFSSCFTPGEVNTLCSDLENEELLKDIRKRTWHKTISSNNTMPSLPAVIFHGQRLSYVLNSVGNATIPYLRELDPVEYGWKIVNMNGEKQIVPMWDSEESIMEINLIRKAFLKKCGCVKSFCVNNSCSCVKKDTLCTHLCSCVGCRNTGTIIDEKLCSFEGDEVDSEEEEEEDVSDDATTILQENNITCPYPINIDIDNEDDFDKTIDMLVA